MSGDVSDRKRLVAITVGNLSNDHIYLSGHHDFFPKECYGHSKKADGVGNKGVSVNSVLARVHETAI